MEIPLSSQFQLEKLMRDIDECHDLEAIKIHCKELLRLHYATRHVTSSLLFER